MEDSAVGPASGGTETGACCGSDDNPMLNPVILGNLFEVCDPKDLPLYRHVCNLWHEASLDAWRSMVPVVIPVYKAKQPPSTNIRRLELGRGIFIKAQDRESRQPAAGDGEPSSSNGNNVVSVTTSEETTLEQIIRSTTDTENTDGLRLASKPFLSYKLNGWTIGTNPRRRRGRRFFVQRWPENCATPKQQEFWRVCGPQMKRLHLYGCAYTKVSGFRDLLFKHTPSLRELKIHGLFTDNSGPADAHQGDAFPPQKYLTTLQLRNLNRWPISWYDTFKGFPNLKTLLLLDVPVEVLNKMLEAVVTLRNEKRQISLKNLVLDISHTDGQHRRISQATANLFEDARLSLENLKIELGSDTEGSVIIQVLGRFLATLRTLHCTRTLLLNRSVTTNDRDCTGFPKFLSDTTFKHLKELRLNGLVAPDFGFSQYTPNLEVLHIDYDRQERLRRSWRELMLHLRVMQVENNMQPTSGERMEKLTTFRTALLFDDIEAYSNFGKWMPNLTRLAAPLTEMTFPVACAAWKSTLKELHITKEGTIGDDITGLGLGIFRPAGDFSHSRSPNITDLIELQKFSQDRGKCYFTDHALWYGFACLPKLKTVQIFVMKELSPGALAILKKKNVDLTWTKCED